MARWTVTSISRHLIRCFTNCVLRCSRTALDCVVVVVGVDVDAAGAGSGAGGGGDQAGVCARYIGADSDMLFLRSVFGYY